MCVCGFDWVFEGDVVVVDVDFFVWDVGFVYLGEYD